MLGESMLAVGTKGHTAIFLRNRIIEAYDLPIDHHAVYNHVKAALEAGVESGKFVLSRNTHSGTISKAKYRLALSFRTELLEAGHTIATHEEETEPSESESVGTQVNTSTSSTPKRGK
jgi:hypothetical protein